MRQVANTMITATKAIIEQEQFMTRTNIAFCFLCDTMSPHMTIKTVLTPGYRVTLTLSMLWRLRHNQLRSVSWDPTVVAVSENCYLAH